MPNWSIKTTETVDGQPVVRNYDVWTLDYPGALNRSWHLDGVAVEIVNKDNPSEKHDLSQSPQSGSPSKAHGGGH
jgi:hypothetical protein